MTVTIENTYTGNNSSTDYSFTFPYLDTTDIKASLDGVVTTAYSLLNATTVRFNSAPASGVAIRIYRETAYENPKATFYPGSAIRAGDLNDNTLQNLYVTQEANDKVNDAWLSGDPTIISTETWYTTDDTKVATTKAIENRVTAKIKSALTDDIVGGTSVNIADNDPSTGKITVNVPAATGSASGSMSAAHYTKLEGIEASATADQTAAEIRTLVESASDSNVFTDADHTKLNGIESNATADQTNDEIRTAVEAASDSNVFTDADHTKLNGIEASATADQTAAEIKTAYESNAQTNPLTDAEKAVIDGVTANTSELNNLDGYTGNTANLNIVAGKTFRASGDGNLTTTSDTEIPSSKVIASHVSSTILATGGFISINNEISFPTTANQPANGVIVSISDAAGTVINGSGVSTTGRTTDGTPATVTINNFPSSLYSETLATGVGMLVTSTGSSNTYNYHKILAAETDVKQLSDDINDFNARYRVASSAPGSNNDDGDLWFDTSANKMKVYNATGSSWDDVASVGQFFINTISSSSETGGGSATFNGSAYRFTLSNPATGGASQLIVSINGVIQKPNGGSSQPSEGFAISGNDIIFAAAPASGSDYFIITQGSSVSIGTPSANSVNSSHIIDGSIVNGDISNSANIAGSKVADDSIPEAKLDVHNAPATDKYLKYTSNGMEWADGASEGTDVKSTGESGGNKFLREDGDGTSSWQAVDTDKIEEGNTSVETIDTGSDGHVKITTEGTERVKVRVDGIVDIGGAGAANVNLNIKGTTGTGNVDTSNIGKLNIGSSHSSIVGENVSFGQLHFGHGTNASGPFIEGASGGSWSTNNLPSALKFYTVPGSSVTQTERLRISKDGSFGIGGANYGSSGQVLTSGGGSAAPSWTTISAAPSIELVAKGTLPNGCPVVIRADGKVGKAGIEDPEWQAVVTPVSNLTEIIRCRVNNINSAAKCIAFTYISDSQLYAVGAKIVDNQLVFGTAVSAGSDFDGCSEMDTCETEGSWGRRVGVAVREGGRIKATMFHCNQNASPPTITWSPSNNIEIGGSNTGNPTISDAAQWNRMAVGYIDNTNGNVYCNGMSYSADMDTISFTGGSVQVVSQGRNPMLSGGVGATTARTLMVYTKSGDSDLYAVPLSFSSTSAPSVGTEKKLYTGTVASQSGAVTNLVQVTPARHTQAGSGTTVHGVVFKDTSNGNTYARLVKTENSDSLATFDSDTNHQVTTENTAWLSCCFDGNTDGEKFVVAYQDDGDSDKLKIQKSSWNGTTLGSFTSAETVDAGDTIDSGIAPTQPGTAGGSLAIGYQITTGTDQLKSRYQKGAVSNVEHNKVIGFSDGAYTDGQTATINIMGNTIGNQSGLTTSNYYYVQQDGTLGTTKDNDITAGGVALSATKLLIVYGKGNY